jgi:hypothetical protein
MGELLWYLLKLDLSATVRPEQVVSPAESPSHFPYLMPQQQLSSTLVLPMYGLLFDQTNTYSNRSLSLISLL